MKRILLLLIAASLNLQAQVLPGGPSAPPNLDDSILTSGLSTVGADSANWAYLIWRSPGPSTLNGRSVAVYLQTVPNSTFTQMGIVNPTTAIPAIQLLISRAATLGADNAACDKDLRDLLRRKNWAGNVVGGIATNTSPFDNKPLAEKISAVVARALQTPEDMASVQSVAHVHPALRMALGRAWASPLPAGAGPMVVELREWTGGVDGGVIGRVSLTPGQGESLTAPGRVVQVPHLKPKSDLTILLRWSVPDALRRQQLHVLGFHVYRVDATFAENNGLPLNATPAQIESFVTTHGPLVMDRVTTTPVPVKKLYDDADVDDFEFEIDPAEPAEHFAADDANRDQPIEEGNLNNRYGGFVDNTRWRYFVRAVDLLGRTGPPSSVGEAVAVLTIPPDVPQGLTVADLPVGAGGQRHHVLRWKANGVPQGVLGRTTQRYAVYRGLMPETGFSNLNNLETPWMFRNLTPLGIVQHSSAVDGWLSFTDTTALPSPANENLSVWYAVTALHDTALDAAVPGIHHQVQSAPSPPAFGVFRDRKGPVAPVGNINVNCGKLVTHFLSSGNEPRTAPAVPEAKIVHLRARCTRATSDIVATRFFFYAERGLTATLLHESPILSFGGAAGDVQTYETTLFDSQTGNLTVYCVSLAVDGCSTIGALSDTIGVDASETVWHVKNFKTGRYSPTAFEPGKELAELGETLSFTSQNGLGPDTARGLLADNSHDTRTVVVQQEITLPLVGQTWVRRGVAQVAGNAVIFKHPGRSLNDGLNPTYRVILLPEGGDCECVHDARPPDQTSIVPIVITSTVPETTREWRLYRRMDEGDLSLVKSLTIDPGQPKPEQVLAEDSNLPPYGAKVRYYLQCFDQNNNPSPFVYLGEVVLVPDPATPLLNTPEAQEMVAGRGRVKLKWFCPPPGVERFRIYVAPLKQDDPLAETVSSGLTTVTTQITPNSIIIPTSYKLPGEPTAKSLTSLRYFDTAELPPGSTSPLHEAEFSVEPGIDYLVWVNVLGLRQSAYVSSTAQLFRWQAPPVVGPEKLVAWPARPMPEVVQIPGVTAYRSAELTGLPTYVPERSTLQNSTAASFYPVVVNLGVLTVPSRIIEHVPADPMSATRPASFTTLTLDEQNIAGGFAGPPYPFSKGSDPASYLLDPGIMPCVLFRQTLIAGEQPGALVQVSPLRHQIAHKVENEGAFPVTTIRDPYIKTLTYLTGELFTSFFSLVDTHPVEEGATYRYYLVNYRADGEISRVVDCGTVTIPETP